MSGTIPSAASHPGPPGRGWMAEASVTVALLALAVLIAAFGAAWTSGATPGPEARMQLGFEAHTRRALEAGEIPLWNPHHFGGRPHLADPSTLAVYPPHVLLRFLPIGAFFVTSFAIHVWAFATGAYLVARQVGAPRPAALLASIGATGAAIVAEGGDVVHSPRVYALAWTPLVLALSMAAVRRPGVLPHAGLVAALAVGLTGMPPGQVYAVVAAGGVYALALWAAPGRERKRLAVQLAALAALAAGTASFQLLPHVRLLAAATWTGGLARDDLRNHDAPGTPVSGAQGLTAKVAPLEGGRIRSECDEALDAGQLLWLGVPGLEGLGGLFSADYARFAALVTEARGDPLAQAATPSAARPPVRRDLLKLMNARYVAGCRPPRPGHEEALARIEETFVLSEDPASLPRAFWTCAPRRVGPRELEYWLREYRYDDTLTLRDANPVINVRWVADLSDADRSRAEAALHIQPRRFLEDRTWEYDLLDPSRANLGAIVSHPAVEDTAGFERGSLSLPPPASAAPPADARRSEWLIGLDPCDDLTPANVVTMDRADGRFVATVEAPRDGLVFIGETFHPDRRASVDGIVVEALKVNLAFIGVPVTAGSHLIELRADPLPFQLGIGVTAFTAVAWSIGAWRVRH